MASVESLPASIPGSSPQASFSSSSSDVEAYSLVPQATDEESNIQNEQNSIDLGPSVAEANAENELRLAQQVREYEYDMNQRMIIFGLRRFTVRWQIVAIILLHFALDAFFLACCTYMLLEYPDAQTDKTGKREWPLLIQFTLTVVLPGTIGKAVLLTKMCKYRPQRLHQLYWRICLIQLPAGQLIFALQLGYYKAQLVTLSIYFDALVLKVSAFIMLFYILSLHLWSILELVSFLNFWWKFGCKPYFERDELIEQLTNVAQKFNSEVHKEHEECAICLSAFEPCDQIISLPCDIRHYYHVGCIKIWCVKSNQCPLCKGRFAMQSVTDFNKKEQRRQRQVSVVGRVVESDDTTQE